MHHARKAVFKELSDFSGWVLNNFDVKDCTQDLIDQTCTVQNMCFITFSKIARNRKSDSCEFSLTSNEILFTNGWGRGALLLPEGFFYQKYLGLVETRIRSPCQLFTVYKESIILDKVSVRKVKFQLGNYLALVRILDNFKISQFFNILLYEYKKQGGTMATLTTITYRKHFRKNIAFFS